nr:uncharacterized protein LOC128700066 [Cherax quadricarinatus]
MRSVVCAVVALMVVFHTGYALKCYVGGVGTQITTNCPGSCMKTAKSFHNNEGSVRICYGFTQDDGCSKVTGGKGIVCYCNTDLCNTAATTSAMTLLLPLLLLLTHLLQ